MKKILKSVVASILAIIARAVIHKYRPHIVMVTGSVGKTSAKDAVASVLEARFLVRSSEKSFNSEFGVPFTILGVGNPWGHPFAWLTVIKSAFALLFLPNHYPNMLVLEAGADRPGDLAWILKIVTPDAVVVTRLPDIPVHVEAYTCPEAVREEEFSPAYALSPSAPLIISADKPNTYAMARRTAAHIITYGVSPTADVRLSHEVFHKEHGVVVGMSARIVVGDQHGSVKVYGSVGKTQLLPTAAAIAVGSAFDISLTEAIAALEKYTPPPGRGRLLKGKNDSIIIDDSYNASPVAIEEALSTLKSFPGAVRRIAVLGDMLELGRYSVQEHEHIGALAHDSADLIIAVGIRARRYALPAAVIETQFFDSSATAARALLLMIRPGDVVLIKGSQSIRTERIVEALLANPSDASRLVRQETEWKRRI